MMPPDHAWGVMLRHLRPLSIKCRALDKALGCCLAEDVRADRDFPPADRSAMDGYAVRSLDVAGGPCVLRLVGEVAAGSAARPRVGPGTCARILTGGNLPPGADSVVMVEATEEQSGRVKILSPPARGANILRRGEDARNAAILLRAGAVLRSPEIGVCAMVGKGKVRVHGRPRIALICTGAELRAPGARVGPHEIRNTNGPALSASLAEWGFGCVSHPIVPDRVDRLAAAIRQASRACDVVLLTGGMSVGKYDVAREAIERVGATVRFHGVAMKPGKPFLFATMPGGRLVFGMPGTPLGALTGFHEFVLPAVRRLSGMGRSECRPLLRLPLALPLASKGGRIRLILGRVRWEAAGPQVEGVDSHSSSDLASAARADGVLIIPAEVREMKAGHIIAFRPWRPLP